MSEGDFLSRWSRRKHAARRGEAVPDPMQPVVPAPDKSIPGQAPSGLQGSPASIPDPPSVPRLGGDASATLPPVESLTPESDFAPFMQPNVDGALRRTALKTLFQDPRFNVMDGLDVYIDDYTKPDPLPEGWLEKMNQVAHLGHHQPPTDPAAAAAEGADGAASGVSAESSAIASPESPADTPSEPAPAQDSASPASEPHSRS